MNVLDIIVYVFNSLTGGSFTLMTLTEISDQASGFTYWIQIFDVRFIASCIIWLSVFYFAWKVTYQLFFRLFCILVQFPRRWRNK